MTEKLGDISIDDLISHGLYDPSADDAADQLFALDYVIRLGATLEDIIESGGDLHSLDAPRRLRPDMQRFTLAQAAERAGLALEVAIRVNRASGFADPDPEARLFGDEDVEVLQLFQAGIQFFGEDLMAQFVRVFGLAMSRVADALISAFTVYLGDQNQAKEVDPAQLADANDTAAALIPNAVRAMDILLRRHMKAKRRMSILPSGDWEGVDALDRAVGFCDFVGYTSMSEQLPTRELAEFLADFEGRAADLITQHGGSVVKLIGDEVMFVAPNASVACIVGRGLVAAFDKDEHAQVRVGLAAGRVLLREGDYHGPVVNLAARLVKLAPPGAVLAPATFRDSVDGVAFEDAGSPPLKGFESPVDLVAIARG